MKYIVSLYLGLFFVSCTSGELEPSHRTGCLDAEYVNLFRSYDLDRYYGKFLETHGNTSNSLFYLYMVYKDKNFRPKILTTEQMKLIIRLEELMMELL